MFLPATPWFARFPVRIHHPPATDTGLGMGFALVSGCHCVLPAFFLPSVRMACSRQGVPCSGCCEMRRYRQQVVANACNQWHAMGMGGAKPVSCQREICELFLQPNLANTNVLGVINSMLWASKVNEWGRVWKAMGMAGLWHMGENQPKVSL